MNKSQISREIAGGKVQSEIAKTCMIEQFFLFTACPGGMQQNPVANSQPICTQCPEGQVSNGRTACSTCTAPFTNANFAQTQCVATCPGGQGSILNDNPNSNDQCTREPCDAGQILNNLNQCITCNDPTPFANVGRDTCLQNCPAGQVQNPVTQNPAANQCLTLESFGCSSGQIPNIGTGTGCLTCANTQIVSKDGFFCLPHCPFGQISNGLANPRCI